MFFIIEGPDGAGKTTLVEQLKSQMPVATVLRFGVPKDADAQFLMYADAIMQNANRAIILDRAWYSELVYGPVMRDGSKLTVPHISALEAMVATNGGGMVIHCTAPIRTLWRRCSKRGEDYVKTIEQLGELREGYFAVFKQSTLPVVLNDTGR